MYSYAVYSLKATYKQCWFVSNLGIPFLQIKNRDTWHLSGWGGGRGQNVLLVMKWKTE